ncbi:M48 family metallopeptidase [Pollutibacter soli]|uniref:M48 family metallopeptidase n=1 Tax=Pollutibacter soli TaxID=3034157 RepID=UPI003013288B
MNLNISSDFRKMAIRAVLHISLFILVYIALVFTATALMALCVFAGISLILIKPGFLTIAIGLGLAGMGVFVLIFLIKFIFRKYVTDRSHLVEITQEQQPELFAMIRDIVDEVKTDFPKKIYLSADVNAAVFYDSSFWSMFFPIRKNLMIGMGLVNSVTADELKAVLSHEFGHFSQRSMKIGSYVYNVNRIIYNMLYENNSYENVISTWASFSSYFAFFVKIGIRLIQGIQWVLHKMYNIVNLSHLRLAREMEFHADAVAAHVTGSAPLMTSLRRLDFAGNAYQTVLEYHREEKINVSKKNIYAQHQFVMQFLAKENDLTIEHNLPQMAGGGVEKFKSKLVIKNQWDSHPPTEDRIAKLAALNIVKTDPDNRPAGEVFRDLQHLELQLTQMVLPVTDAESGKEIISESTFENVFTKNFLENAQNKLYNGYYDHKQPSGLAGEAMNMTTSLLAESPESLFSRENVSLIYTLQSLESDLQLLRQIREGNHDLKTFDYDGEKFLVEDCGALIGKLENDLSELKGKIATHDELIFRFFETKAAEKNLSGEFNRQWDLYRIADNATDELFNFYTKLYGATRFIYEQTSVEEIDIKLKDLAILEVELRKFIKGFLSDPLYEPVLSDVMRADFGKYLEKELNYFVINEYDNDHLRIFFTAMNQFQTVMSKSFLYRKKSLLEFQATLYDHPHAKVA